MSDGNLTSNDKVCGVGGVAGSLPTKFVYVVVALAAILALVLGISIFLMATQGTTSTAKQSIVSAQVESKPASTASADSADASKSSEAANESGNSDEQTIEEDESPLSSGLGGGEPASGGGLSFWPIAIVGIVAVAVFFFVLMRRMHHNVRHMNSMFK